ncbi:hypothetical protein ABZ054_15135, partial [Streptomyces sp. NPDC006324]
FCTTAKEERTGAGSTAGRRRAVRRWSSSGVQSLLAVPEEVRRRAARTRAEGFAWDRSVAAFLRAHDALPVPEGLPAPEPLVSEELPAREPLVSEEARR